MAHTFYKVIPKTLLTRYIEPCVARIDFIDMDEDRMVKERNKKVRTDYSLFIFIGVVIVVAIAAILTILHKEQKVESLILDKTNVSLGIHETDRLTVSVKPEDAQPILIWESSDENIAKVTDGVVMACNVGHAVVRVSVEDNQDLYAVCEYTVSDPDVNMQTLDILEDPIVLRPGGHQQLTLNVSPEKQNDLILWSSTNESVVRVSPRGKVEAIKVGYAKIIATSDRTGASDTAFVSVEGAGDVNVVSQVDNSQKTKVVIKSSQAPASKSIPAKVSNSTPAKTAKPITKSSVSKAATKSYGVKNLGYATFKGTWPNDVKGRMEFKSTHIIDSRDPKRRMASPGDYVIGEWSEGHLVQGIWYGADRIAKGSILIGK